MNINLLGPFNQMGYGIACQNIGYGLRKTANVSLFPIGPIQVDENYVCIVDELKNNASMYDPIAPSLRVWHQFDMAEHVGRGLHIGFPFFELDTFTPRETSHLSKLDRIFVTSEWAKEVIQHNKTHHDVRVVPLGVDREIFHENVECGRLEPDFTVFLNVGKWEKRKGHDFLLTAFNKAFKPTDKVVLKMLTYNPLIGVGNDEWARLYLGSPMGSQIKLLPRLTTQRLVSRVLMEADCGVFPSRAEGWNLELLEMMSMGKHVITTFVTAHRHFANKENARLIYSYKLEPAEDGIWFRGQGNWARLDKDQEEQLIVHLREVHRLKQLGELPKNEAGIETARRFSWDNTAKTILEEVK